MSDFPENSGNLTVFHDVEEYLGQNGKIARTDNNFVFREGQLKMALEYQKTLKENSSLVCEAGTGTGKTFAYLLPALLSSKTILISTASKALQDQLIQKDLPSICNILNIPHNYMSLKGFSNYLCKDKYYELSNKFASSNGLKLDDYIDESAKKIKNTKQNERKKSDIELLDDDSDFKKGVIKTYNAFSKAGIVDLKYKMYDGLRHDILHELDRLVIYNDINNWINKKDI